MKQSDYFKRLLAYSSIGQIGYILFWPSARRSSPRSGTGEPDARDSGRRHPVIGALYHVINHAIFKGLAILNQRQASFHATGTKDLNKLGGLHQAHAA